MNTFDWKPEYAIGHAAIDAQHQQLIAILNELAALLQDGTAAPGDAAHKVFGHLAQYVTAHFAFEEDLIGRAGYPADLLAAHRAEHDRILSQVQDFETVFESGDAEVLRQLMPFLYGEWLIHHICGTDKDYAPYVADAT